MRVGPCSRLVLLQLSGFRHVRRGAGVLVEVVSLLDPRQLRRGALFFSDFQLAVQQWQVGGRVREFPPTNPTVSATLFAMATRLWVPSMLKYAKDSSGNRSSARPTLFALGATLLAPSMLKYANDSSGSRTSARSTLFAFGVTLFVPSMLKYAKDSSGSQDSTRSTLLALGVTLLVPSMLKYANDSSGSRNSARSTLFATGATPLVPSMLKYAKDSSGIRTSTEFVAPRACSSIISGKSGDAPAYVRKLTLASSSGRSGDVPA